nr:gibberellin 2-beta-dioxygenase 8-like [Ipomoea batatas]
MGEYRRIIRLPHFEARHTEKLFDEFNYAPQVSSEGERGVNHGGISAGDIGKTMRKEEVKLFKRRFKEKAMADKEFNFSEGSYRVGITSAESVRGVSWSEAFQRPAQRYLAHDATHRQLPTSDHNASSWRYVVDELGQKLAAIFWRRKVGHKPDNCLSKKHDDVPIGSLSTGKMGDVNPTPDALVINIAISTGNGDDRPRLSAADGHTRNPIMRRWRCRCSELAQKFGWQSWREGGQEPRHLPRNMFRAKSTFETEDILDSLQYWSTTGPLALTFMTHKGLRLPHILQPGMTCLDCRLSPVAIWLAINPYPGGLIVQATGELFKYYNLL